jgi:hypothetical protein
VIFPEFTVVSEPELVGPVTVNSSPLSNWESAVGFWPRLVSSTVMDPLWTVKRAEASTEPPLVVEPLGVMNSKSARAGAVSPNIMSENDTIAKGREIERFIEKGAPERGGDSD